MTNLINMEKKVLDKGFIRVVDVMGGDDSIVQAARVSYGSGTKTLRDDKALIRFLMYGGHYSPLEMDEIKFHVKMPIFVARQWIRHRTANVNEISYRYSEVLEEFYFPKPEDVRAQSTRNKQGRCDEEMDKAKVDAFLESLKTTTELAFCNYQKAIEAGVARELARVMLPVSTYTQWYWKIDLRNLLHFIKLRSSPHAQYEIREYAKAMLEILKEWCPAVYEAFLDFEINGVSFSSQAMEILSKNMDRQATINDINTAMKYGFISKSEGSFLLEKISNSCNKDAIG